MFDRLLNDLKKLEDGVSVPVQIRLDDNGYMDRKCPSEDCQSEFKIEFDDWRGKISNEVVYCPTCKFEAPATNWNTKAQNEHLEKSAFAFVQGIVEEALGADARDFNRKQPRGGLLSISMSYQPSNPPVLIPPIAAEGMRQRYQCEACACRYSSLGAAFFCPACGDNSALSTFTASVDTVSSSVKNVENIRRAVEAAADKGIAENTVRQILENGLVKLVSSFQRYAEAKFFALPNAGNFKVRKNLFQNLSDSSQIWNDATNVGYQDLLSASELVELVVFFQQRHILSHREGIVDEEYLDKSGDRTFLVGQKLVIKGSSVLRLAELVTKLAKALSQISET